MQIIIFHYPCFFTFILILTLLFLDGWLIVFIADFLHIDIHIFHVFKFFYKLIRTYLLPLIWFYSFMIFLKTIPITFFIINNKVLTDYRYKNLFWTFSYLFNLIFSFLFSKSNIFFFFFIPIIVPDYCFVQVLCNYPYLFVLPRCQVACGYFPGYVLFKSLPISELIDVFISTNNWLPYLINFFVWVFTVW